MIDKKEKTITIEATGDFPFSFYIEKAVPSGDEEHMSIKGVASTTNVDHDQERMSESSLKAMAEIINQTGVPLRVEHQKEDNAVIGSVFKAWVDERNQLWIEANLDKSHPGASMLYKALKTGAKLGLSVGGRVKHAVKEFSESAGTMIKTFYNVVLDEVSVTSRPANYDAWLVSKSIISKDEDGERFVDSPIYKEFLFENQGFDYLQSFAKSIPDNSWKKVNIIKSNEENSMSEKEIKKDSTKEEETKEKAGEGAKEEVKEKAEDKKEDETATKSEDTFKSMVMKTLEGLTAVVAKLAKGSSKEETEKTEETTIMEDKKEKSEEKTDDKKEEKAETKEEEASTKDYHIKSMQNVLKRIEDLSKAMEETTEETKEKAEDKKEEEETTKSMDLDKFVATVEKSINDLQEKFSKGGKRTLGLAEMIVNAIRTDKGVQKEIQDMMKEPGFKKSMQFGVPMMRTKDGKAYRLTAQVMGEEVEKSRKDVSGKSFKEVYNQNFSSSAVDAGE